MDANDSSSPGQAPEGAEPFAVGDRVRIKGSVRPKLLRAVERRLGGRIGIVERCFIPAGRGQWKVRLLWLSKSGKPLDVDFWDAQALEIAP